MANKSVFLSCPKCGTTISIFGEIVESKISEQPTFDPNSFLDLFRPVIRKNLDVKVEGNHLSVEFKGRYDKKVYREIFSVIRNSGGTLLKSHFVLPIENVKAVWEKSTDVG